jgi:hypothetical protein
LAESRTAVPYRRSTAPVEESDAGCRQGTCPAAADRTVWPELPVEAMVNR